MASLYNIENNILNIFSQIEENDGEITEELDKLLLIEKDNLKEKLEQYYKTILSWEAENDACKAEADRLTTVRKVKENRIKRLKSSILDAVVNFGNTGKTGNKFIELEQIRLFTRESRNVEINNDRINILIECFKSYIEELVKNDILVTGDEISLNSILDAINAIIESQYGSDFKKFEISDLTTLELSITTVDTIHNLFKNNIDILKAIANNPINIEIRDVTSKLEWKNKINIAKENNLSVPTVASIITNNNLQMK